MGTTGASYPTTFDAFRLPAAPARFNNNICPSYFSQESYAVPVDGFTTWVKEFDFPNLA